MAWSYSHSKIHRTYNEMLRMYLVGYKWAIFSYFIILGYWIEYCIKWLFLFRLLWYLADLCLDSISITACYQIYNFDFVYENINICLSNDHIWNYRNLNSHIFQTHSDIYTPGIYAEGYIVFDFLFIHSFICLFVLPSRSWNYFKVLRSSNSSGVYLTNHSSESIHIWTIGTLKGQLSFHDSSPQGPCPGVGLEVKTLDTFKKCFSTFMLWNQLMQIVGRTWLNLVTWTCGSWSEGQHDLYFQGPVILSYILKTILSMYIIPWEYESVWPDV